LLASPSASAEQFAPSRVGVSRRTANLTGNTLRSEVLIGLGLPLEASVGQPGHDDRHHGQPQEQSGASAGGARRGHDPHLIAFRTYSRHDLDRMFSVGFEAGQPD
jgi:hypothetical protein